MIVEPGLIGGYNLLIIPPGLRIPPVSLPMTGLLLLPLLLAAPEDDLKHAFDAKAELYAPAPGYTEGPTWLDGDVFFCSGALLRITAEKKVLKYLDIGPAGTYLLA